MRTLACITAALSVFALSSVALADGTVAVDSSKAGKWADKFIGCQYEISSPRDLATGQASGKRQRQPLCISKVASATTPQWIQAVSTNEVMKSVALDFVNGVRIRLTNATVSSFKASSADGKDIEEICMAYQTIVVSHKSGGSASLK